MKKYISIAEQFAGSKVLEIREFGHGNINDTFLVTLGSGESRFILQRINMQVFRQPHLVMRNMRIITNHIHSHLSEVHRRWEMPRVLLTREGHDLWVDAEGQYWRAITFINGAESSDTIQNAAHAREVGYALGLFHTLLSDIAIEKLADTLEGFHITPRYLQHYDHVLRSHVREQTPELNFCLKFVQERREWAQVLERAKAEGVLPLRPIHGDPKVNNVLIDTVTRQAVSIIDLDTVKPGLVHYDIGDCVRSGCNPLGEEVEEWERVYFDPDLCRAMLEGYLSQAKEFLAPHEYEYIYDAIRLIAFELGLRFLTDYLEGNVYFKVRYAQHNLLRALVQFKLTESIEAHEKAIRSIVANALR